MPWLAEENPLKERGVPEQVIENVPVRTPTGDMLVNQLLTGLLDVSVVYLSNAAGTGEKLDAIRIRGLSCFVATQPFAVSIKSQFPALGSRLFEKFDSGEKSALRVKGIPLDTYSMVLCSCSEYGVFQPLRASDRIT